MAKFCDLEISLHLENILPCFPHPFLFSHLFHSFSKYICLIINPFFGVSYSLSVNPIFLSFLPRFRALNKLLSYITVWRKWTQWKFIKIVDHRVFKKDDQNFLGKCIISWSIFSNHSWGQGRFPGRSSGEGKGKLEGFIWKVGANLEFLIAAGLRSMSVCGVPAFSWVAPGSIRQSYPY